jgi:predicted DNA-binding protein
MEVTMRFTIEMDDAQYERLETLLADTGTTIEDVIADFFDDMDDSFVAEERIAALKNGKECVIPWTQVRASNGMRTASRT